MSIEVTTALITIFGGVIIATMGYWFSRNKDREAEWRKEKLHHYKNFVASLSGVIAGETTDDGQKAFAKACNNLILFAPQKVIEALEAFRTEIKTTNPNSSLDRHDNLLTVLMYEIRKDMEVFPKDDKKSFRARIWASGVKPDN